MTGRKQTRAGLITEHSSVFLAVRFPALGLFSL
jgi:hypothetical protein